MTTLSFAQIEDLWTSNGGNPLAAPVMAAIAIAESGGRTDAANTKPPDASYGLWQVNYYGSLAPGRAQAYGTPAQLVADPNRQARAAISISGNGSNLKPWTTYTSGAYKPILAAQGGGLGSIPALPSLTSQMTLETPQGDASYDEGYLFQFSGEKVLGQTVVPGISMRRSTARKLVGGGVMVAGATVGLVGVFVLVGAGRRLPSPLQGLSGALKRVPDQADRQAAKVTPAAPDELAARRRARARERKGQEAAEGFSTAVEAGNAAAEAAGPF